MVVVRACKVRNGVGVCPGIVVAYVFVRAAVYVVGGPEDALRALQLDGAGDIDDLIQLASDRVQQTLRF